MHDTGFTKSEVIRKLRIKAQKYQDLALEMETFPLRELGHGRSAQFWRGAAAGLWKFARELEGKTNNER